MRTLSTTPAVLTALACILALGCPGGDATETETTVDTDGTVTGQGPTPTSGPTESDSQDSDDTDNDTDDDPVPVNCDDGPLPGPMPRLVRLSHRQYDNTVRTLLQLPDSANPASQFLSDPPVQGFDNNAAALVVKDRLGRDYRRAAESLAEQATTPDKLEALVPCSPEGDGSACAAQFITSFGRKVYRRPLTAAEQNTYNTLYSQGQGLYEDGPAFAQGLRFVIEAMLQSPHFLYRIELSDSIEDGVKIPLNGYELATRMSYMLWNSMPDEELLAAAESGTLATPEGLETQARRLLADERSRDPVADFHYQWLELRKLSNLQKSTDAFPNYNPAMAGAMAEETQRFIRQVIFDLDGDYAALMTAPFTIINADLGSIYGIDGLGPEFQEVDLDPLQRGGVLTHPSFLATHAFPHISSPIHRGAFFQGQVLCNPPPLPPGDADLNLPAIEGEIKTTRQQVEAHTEQNDYCTACHKFVINPPGFAFENYDALGQWRTIENDTPIDASSAFLGKSGEMFTFTNAIDLLGQVAESNDGPQCYLTQWFRYGFARSETPIDRCTINELHEALVDEGYNIQELLVALTKTTTFRYRAVEDGA